jgi:hypothetical protein
MKYLAIGLIALMAACSSGSDDERVLVLGGGDFTEEEWRTNVRISLDASNCASFNDLSTDEAIDLISAANATAGETPVQAPNEDDRERAAEIVLEECERITSS